MKAIARMTKVLGPALVRSHCTSSRAHHVLITCSSRSYPTTVNRSQTQVSMWGECNIQHAALKMPYAPLERRNRRLFIQPESGRHPPVSFSPDTLELGLAKNSPESSETTLIHSSQHRVLARQSCVAKYISLRLTLNASTAASSPILVL